MMFLGNVVLLINSNLHYFDWSERFFEAVIALELKIVIIRYL